MSPERKGFGAPVRDFAAGPAVAQRPTRPFALLGATWNDPRAGVGGTVEVRTHAVSGRWTRWQSLEVDESSGTGRGSTDPLWVGDSDGVQARIVTADGEVGPQPAGLRLDLINPGADPPAARPRLRPRTAVTPAAPSPDVRLQPRPRPRLITRSGWGANEKIVALKPEYTTDVQTIFVHHTAGTNFYTCGQSARIIRAIQAFHVRSKGWNDIGYNFVVDKCGTLFEGRKGGESLPVLGAHTLGFNSHSAAIAVIGNYTAIAAPARVKNIIAQIAAYKLGAYRNLANTRVVLTSNGSDRYLKGTRVVLNRIAGHRDAGRTECPGNTLYAQLPAIRAIAAAGPAGFRLIRMAGATYANSRFYTRGLIRPLWTTGTPSALMDRFDVLVDSRLVGSLPNTNRTTTLRLAPGKHTLTVRAVHLSGRTKTTTIRVVAIARAR